VYVYTLPCPNSLFQNVFFLCCVNIVSMEWKETKMYLSVYVCIPTYLGYLTDKLICPHNAGASLFEDVFLMLCEYCPNGVEGDKNVFVGIRVFTYLSCVFN